MSKTKNPSKHDEIWLGDDDQGLVPEPLTEALDRIYASGPSETAMTAVQIKLDRALKAEEATVVYYDYVPTSPIGAFFVGLSEQGVVALSFEESEEIFLAWLQRRGRAGMVREPSKLREVVSQVLEYLEGRRNVFTLSYDLRSLTPFQRDVLTTVQEVPRGEYLTYGELARRIGRPGAARAVGRALGSNPIPILIPCHRVLAADGSLGGYSGRGGVRTKEALLRLEGALQ
ncbi:MAG: methylated-DNA--[protein]-cysteine S-methyltransferase [Chloroflexi bacterium]|nr:methylated-DNA--[protein]-cysteine S-methyltransferase [Chloroflexota bacterium]